MNERVVECNAAAPCPGGPARFLAAVAVVLAGLAGCGDPQAVDEGPEALPDSPTSATEAPTSGPHTTELLEPEPFAPGLLPPHLEQYRVTFTPNGDTAYVGLGEEFFPLSRQATIYRIVREGGEWGGLEVAPFSGVWPDIDPFIDPEGGFLYFSSIRPGPYGETEAIDLWRVQRRGLGWGRPERLPVSTSEDELFPSVDREGRLYFARPLPDRQGEWGIWVAEADDGGSVTPRPLGPEVNRPGAWNFNPEISSDGARLLFTRLIPDEAAATGFGRIHLARRTDLEWEEVRPLSRVVNSEQDEFHPSLSPDGRVLYFVRRDPFAEEPRGRLFSVPFEAVMPD